MAGRISDRFSWPVRVYYEDTDLGGVVYYANYLRFLERARSEWLRHLGVSQTRLLEEARLLFAITRVAIDYQKPARFEDELVVTVELARLRRASMEFRQAIHRGGTDGELLCTAQVTAACLDADSMRPKPLPAHLFPE
ncbi:MAG TPA: tol-pal system-associated acyl-CoA thioesterase [Gammaproteobacteria bacterium]|nr:tol-pal system-associated acyl-CoA thioesterase [Gammaproteobacteria bacterium]HRP87385.1 tol-pal system-associated acyl-CoA thioesterase [Gammaproteobacteria bacterium]